MTAPTLVSYSNITAGTSGDNTAWGSQNTPRATASITWLAGDILVALAGCDSADATLGLPTATGLTFSSVFGGQVGTTSSNCGANIWTASPGAGGSSTVSFSISGGSLPVYGGGVWLWRSSSGLGNHSSNISAETLSLIRSGNNSCVVGGIFDWNAGANTGYAFTPTVGNDREHTQHGANYTSYVADWGDQGTAGTTSYGISGITGGGPFTNVLIEILGSASGTDANVTFPQSIAIHP